MNKLGSSSARCIAIAAMLGVVIAVLFRLLWVWLEHYPAIDAKLGVLLQNIMLVVWPSSLILLAEVGDDGFLSAAFLLSAALNGIVYGIAAICLWYGLTRHSAFLYILLAALLGLGWRLLTL